MIRQGKISGTGIANDNEQDHTITGAEDADRAMLFEKWQLDDDQKQAWQRGIDSIHKSIGEKCADLSRGLLSGLRNADAIWTASALALVKLLFCWLRGLPRPEAIYVLEEIARSTDKFIEGTQNAEKQNKITVEK